MHGRRVQTPGGEPWAVQQARPASHAASKRPRQQHARLYVRQPSLRHQGRQASGSKTSRFPTNNKVLADASATCNFTEKVKQNQHLRNGCTAS